MFGERLREQRKKNGFTQVILSEKLGVSKGAVAMWEMGKRKPDYETLCLLSDMFDVRADYLLGLSDDDTSVKLFEEKIRQIDSWTTENNLQTLFQTYLKLDDYGKGNVDNLIRNEYSRCLDQETDESIDGIKLSVMIKK